MLTQIIPNATLLLWGVLAYLIVVAVILWWWLGPKDKGE